ncbi:hypothetical protein QYE76_037767 [Lolium multiflorum]|uniref:Retrotransposon gag domain-containing protein n=1 Tax=Lolium multiflorum TaxID=4521 RepID=A0AAD8Q2T2_LOLMU|nr:hypothetical protein QYE76_037767 [Lolium multiflorum]
MEGVLPEGALDGVDLSTPSEERTRSLRQEINFMVAHSLHRHSESLVNTLERVALRVIQEIMSHQYSPSGPALGTHQGEVPLQSRPPLPFALAAPEAPNSSAYVVYKIGGDPSDYQFLHDAPKEIPHGYACAYVPDCSTWAPSNQVATAGTSGATGGTSEADPEKQTWLAKYATPTKLPSPAPAVGSEPEKQAWLVKYATPTNLQGSAPSAGSDLYDPERSVRHDAEKEDDRLYQAVPQRLGMISASDELRVRYFSQSLTGSAFGWYTSLPPNSVQTWKQLEERFHEQYHSEASEAGIADLAQVRQKRGETVSEYIQRFRTVRNRCYSVHVSEKEAVELAVVGLSSSIKDVASQADYPSLAHMVQKLSAYEQRHPDVYQDKFKRVVTMVDAGEDEVATGEQEVAVAEWTRAAGPVTCKWVKPPGPPRGFDFDVTKTEQIFDLLLAEKHIKIPEGHKVPTVQELNGKPYCKWHNTFTHTTNDCRVWRQQIQMAIENGRLIFNQYAMKVDTHPFPAVNMVEFAHLGGCQPDFSANISMVELGHRSEKDGDEDSCSQSKDTEGAAPCDRLRQDGKRYVTEGEVKNIRYQRPLSDHLLNKYVSRYDQRRRHGDDDERGRLARNDRRHRRHNHDEERQERHAREQDNTDRHWDRHCWDSGMSRLPTIGNCPECNQKRKEAANVSVFERLGPLPPQSRRAEPLGWKISRIRKTRGKTKKTDLENHQLKKGRANFRGPMRCYRLLRIGKGDDSKRSYLWAITALVVAIVVTIGAASGGLVVAPMAADWALVVFIFFVSVVLVAVKSLRLPGQGQNRLAAARRRSSRRRPLPPLLLPFLPGRGEVTEKSRRLSSSVSPTARKRRSLSPSVKDLSSSDRTRESWSSLSHFVGARISYAACVPHEGVDSRMGEDT